jgi:hypothetical protein
MPQLERWVITGPGARDFGLGVDADPLERIKRRLNARPCMYAWHEDERKTCEELLRRLESAARARRFVSYAEFVRGITFKLHGRDESVEIRVIDTERPRHGDEDVIDDYARYLGAASYRDSGVLLNALVVPVKHRARPTKGFCEWAGIFGLSLDWTRPYDDRFIAAWGKAVDAVHERYQTHRPPDVERTASIGNPHSIIR